jgi:hypothetical protein
MTKMNKYVVASLGVVILFTISGCGPQSKAVESFEMTEEFTGLKLDESHFPTLIYRRPGAPTLAAYNRLWRIWPLRRLEKCRNTSVTP